MGKRAVIIINEQHTLLQVQEELLNKRFDSWDVLLVPASGWDLETQKDKCRYMENNYIKANHEEYQQGWSIVFVSPLPYMIKRLSSENSYPGMESTCFGDKFHTGEGDLNKILVFHNDKREKKELPGGKIINVVARTGWGLV